MLVLAGTGTQTLGVASGSTGQLIFAAPTSYPSFGVQLADVTGLQQAPGAADRGRPGSPSAVASIPPAAVPWAVPVQQLLTFNGTVTASAGQTIAVIGSSVTNAGSGSNAPSLQGNGGTLTITNLQGNAGGISATAGGTLTLNGSWQNTAIAASESPLP